MPLHHTDGNVQHISVRRRCWAKERTPYKSSYVNIQTPKGMELVLRLGVLEGSVGAE